MRCEAAPLFPERAGNKAPQSHVHSFCDSLLWPRPVLGLRSPWWQGAEPVVRSQCDEAPCSTGLEQGFG